MADTPTVHTEHAVSKRPPRTTCLHCGADDPGFADSDADDQPVVCESCGRRATWGDWTAADPRNAVDGEVVERVYDLGEDDERACRVCGCTDLDCSGCIERTGKPCYWVDDDLCSACEADDELVTCPECHGEGFVESRPTVVGDHEVWPTTEHHPCYVCDEDGKIPAREVSR